MFIKPGFCLFPYHACPGWAPGERNFLKGFPWSEDESTVTGGTEAGGVPSLPDLPPPYSLHSCLDSFQLHTERQGATGGRVNTHIYKYAVELIQKRTMSASHRESRGCRCWETTVALWSACQGSLEPGGDLEMNPWWI